MGLGDQWNHSAINIKCLTALKESRSGVATSHWPDATVSEPDVCNTSGSTSSAAASCFKVRANITDPIMATNRSTLAISNGSEAYVYKLLPTRSVSLVTRLTPVALGGRFCC